MDGPGRLNVPLGIPIQLGQCSVTYFGVHWPRRYRTSRSLGAALRDGAGRFDIVHIHGIYGFHTFAGAHYCYRHAVPYVLRPHGTLNPYHRKTRRIRKRIYEWLIENRHFSRAAAVHYTSVSERRAAEAFGIKTPGYVIPLGVAPQSVRCTDPCHTPETWRREWTGRRLVVFVGRLSEKKGIPILLDAFQHVAARVADAHLVVAGPDDDNIGRQELKRASDLGLGSRVSFIGAIGGQEKACLLSHASVFCLPSEDENFAVAVAEAMTAGTPAIVTDMVAIHEDIQQGEAGLVVSRTPQAFAAGIVALLEDEAERRRLGENGYRLARRQFSWDSIAEQLEALYKNILATRGVGPR